MPPKETPLAVFVSADPVVALSLGGISQVPEGLIPGLGLRRGGSHCWCALPYYSLLCHLQTHQELLPEGKEPAADQRPVHSLYEWRPEELSTVFMAAHVHVHMCVCEHVSLHTRESMRMCVRTYVCMHVHKHMMYMCTWAHTCAFMHRSL